MAAYTRCERVLPMLRTRCMAAVSDGFGGAALMHVCNDTYFEVDSLFTDAKMPKEQRLHVSSEDFYDKCTSIVSGNISNSPSTVCDEVLIELARGM